MHFPPEYEKELLFFLDLLKNYSFTTSLFADGTFVIYENNSSEISSDTIQTLGNSLLPFLDKVMPRTIYYYTDSLNSKCIILQLPDEYRRLILVIGPYTTLPFSRDAIMTIMEKYNIASTHYNMMEQYYNSLPFIPEESALSSLVNTFCNHLWTGVDYKVEKVTEADLSASIQVSIILHNSDHVSHFLDVNMLERRYENENQLLSIIAQGQVHKLDQFLVSPGYTLPVEARISDPLRNMKNYLIILNTLLRKAAEQGGLHPIYIDDVSREFFLKIENMHSCDESLPLQKSMMRKYCLLVHNHSLRNYSQLVQRVIIQIDSDLTADLSLSALAEAMNVNASYLSSHFHHETGLTLTNYVNNRRIEHAVSLLNTTNLQVQSIAQYCGISDINYFTRIFKKMIGMTPSQYRESISK